MSTLYLVATPIGNLEDITARALRTLREVRLVLAEDTRQTMKLFSHFEIHTALESFHEYSQGGRVQGIIKRLQAGESIALVTDAGTPGISDPGAHLITEAHRVMGNELTVVPIPGPSAVTAALSVSGFPADTFSFLGFPPAKKGRTSFFDALTNHQETTVLYESPHRIGKTLTELAERMPERPMVICRELTKQFETIYRGTASELAKGEVVREQGEFVIVLGAI